MNLKFTKAVWRLSLCLLVTAPLMLLFQNLGIAPSSEFIEVEGELHVMFEDNASNGRLHYFLKTDKGSLELKPSHAQERQLQAGARVRIKGMKSGEMLALDGSSSSVTTVASAPLPNTFGERKVVVLLVNFQDNPIQPYTLADGNNVLSQVNNFIKENSLNQTWVTGTSFGWYTLATATTCDASLIGSEAKQAATNAGVNLSSYQHIVYVFPRNTSCPWSGQGSVNGGDILINGRLELKTVAHELGHNFGLYHSHASECGASIIGSNCTSLDYGDAIDIMGNSNVAHFNAFQKERLGWLNNGSMPPITTVSSSGSYILSTYEAANSGAKALKILKSTDTTTDAKTYYYVEFRQPLGADAFIATLGGGNISSGVVIRMGTENSANSSYLLDMTPESSVYYEWNDSALVAGRSYTDSAAGITITPTSLNSTGVTVNVTLGSAPPPVCTKANPIITPSSQTKSGAAGSVISYSVNVKNQDSSSCAASSFSLSRSLPAGWVATLSSSSLSLSPGASASVTLTVTSPSTAAGNNNIIVNAISGAYSASATAIYSVTAPPPPVVNLSVSVSTDKSVYSSGQIVLASAKVLSGSTAVANASVSFQVIDPRGKSTTYNAVSDASGVAKINYSLIAKSPKGVYQIKVNATSQSLSGSASVNFTKQ